MKTTYKKEEVDRVHNDPDYIYSKKHGNSLKKFKELNGSPISDHRIAYLLLMSTADVSSIYNNIIKKARQKMNIDL